jgi:hypothetical protein
MGTNLTLARRFHAKITKKIKLLQQFMREVS